ncbi:MAG: hypothetical protein ACM3VV_03920 [Deltaproteobacteria bacterium]
MILDENTNFNNAIIDNSVFIDYISEFTRNVPEKIKDKEELVIKLKEKKLKEELIDTLLKKPKKYTVI